MDELVEITETFDDVAVEMSSDPAGMVPLSREIIERVTDGDPEPRFATFIIESGWSKSKRYWGPELFADVASEMQAAANGDPIVGYMGHIRKEDDPYVFPEIQLQWVGARLMQSGEKAKLAVKAYVLPDTKGRDYLRRGLVKSVSWRGKVAQELYQQGVRIKKFAIESIDLSRPRAAGMNARLVGALTSEMEEETGGNSVKPEEIAALQANELRAHNPALVQAIETEARRPLEDRVGEMTAAAEAAEPTLTLIPDLRKLLGLKDDVDNVGVVQAVITKLREDGRTLRDSVVDAVLEKKFKLSERGDDASAKLVRKLIVGEMRDRDLSLTGDVAEDEKTVSEMVNSIVDSDESLKTVVSEMEDTPAVPPTTTLSRGGTRELKPGFSNGAIRVRSASPR